MRALLGIIVLVVVLMVLGQYCESRKDPYEEGMHWDYSITCENGFTYKHMSSRRGTIQVLNSDGTPLKCGNKIY